MGSTRSLWFVVLALGAGCGRLGFGEGSADGEDEDGGNMTVGVVDSSARAPAVCERINDIAALSSGTVDLAVTTTPTGATAVWTALAGGDLMAVDIAKDRSHGATALVRSGTFTASSAAYIDGQLVMAGVNTSRTLIHSVPQPLAAAAEIANFDGMFVGKQTLAHSNGDLVAATSCSSGLTMNAFNNQWVGSAGTLSVSTNATINIDMTPIAAEAFAVWSTAASCHYETVTSKSTGTTRQTTTKACPAARVTSRGTEVGMVFEEGTRTGLVIDESATVSVANAVYANGAKAPRVLWDGQRYWVTFLDILANKVVIGYVDEYGMLLTSKLPDAAPDTKAYELGMLDGQPWMFAVEPGTKKLVASRLCVPAY